MTAVTLPNNGLNAGYTTGENGWGAQMNRNLRVLDAMAQARAQDKDSGTPPGSPTSGSMYIVGASASGAWIGQTGKLAIYQSGDDAPTAWTFVTPKSGFRVFVVDEDKYYKYTGSAWVDDTIVAGSGEINTTSNLGGVGLAAAKSGVNLPFKGLSAGQGVNLDGSGPNVVAIRTVYIQGTDPGAVGAGVTWLVV